MASVEDLMDQVRAYVISEGVVRMPSAGGSLPPAFLQPEGGAIAPGDKSGNENHPDIIVSIMRPTGIAAAAMESWLRRDIVEFWMRVRKAPFAMQMEEALRALFVGDLGMREWDMGALRVHSSLEWTALQQVPGVAGPGYAYKVAYVFEYAS